GRANALPWRLPRDLQRFKAFTLGKAVLMGRRTFESIGRPLPQRANLVLTRDRAWYAAGVDAVHSLAEALARSGVHTELVARRGPSPHRRQVIPTPQGRPMFTYVTLGTNDPPRAARFYDAVLGALGLERCDVSEPEWQDWHGWGVYDKEAGRELALWLCPPFDARPASAGNGTMVALVARSWSEVDRFHAAALPEGGKSEGAPGVRPPDVCDIY